MVQPKSRRLITELALELYENRTAPSRGTLDDAENVDNVRGAADWGGWTVRRDREYGGLPTEYRQTQDGLLFLFPSRSTDTEAQLLIQGEQLYFREAFTSSSWNNWHKVPTMADVVPAMRGTLEDGFDADQIRRAEQAGTYHIAASRTYDNLPVTPAAAGTLTLLSGNNENAATQMYIEGASGGLRFYVRELHVMTTVPTWNPWYRIPTADEIGDLIGDGSGIVRSTAVNRIVTSDNPNLPLDDGDLLIVYEE